MATLAHRSFDLLVNFRVFEQLTKIRENSEPNNVQFVDGKKSGMAWQGCAASLGEEDARAKAKTEVVDVVTKEFIQCAHRSYCL
ncbi:hypothetical protein [Hymenobacter sp. GOD-10R]|uniref:hypothetical protein n=1 Tax=Hymenobacter sp. GOD-10R TaxID=3093922 RepID=UPI002D784F7E|nr:hypothetical protein [Hymenobacter sp. GOD-10R]WRQ30610.1 hypothetical protein SD425_10085 [Hymenobacter sp. GOD-10R]